jgi:hypothetical protein
VLWTRSGGLVFVTIEQGAGSALLALEDCPDGLGELRAILLREHEWHVREGLV